VGSEEKKEEQKIEGKIDAALPESLCSRSDVQTRERKRER
jgi:hypothetical protein